MIPWDTLAIAFTLLLGAMIQGVAGFGAALLASPIIMLLRPELIPGAMAIAMAPLVWVMAWRHGRHADFITVFWAVLGWLPMLPLGVYALTTLSAPGMGVLFGILVLLGVFFSLLGGRIVVRPRNAFLAGALACFMSLTTTIGGPPMALLMQHSHGERLLGTLNLYFLFGSTLSLLTYTSQGLLGPEQLRQDLWMVPSVLAGYLLSRPLAGVLHRGYTRWAVLLVAGVAGVILIGRNFGGGG